MLTGSDIHEFIGYWLRTPVNSRLGQGFGQDLKAFLQLPLVTGAADDFIDKMREDLFVLDTLPANSTNIYQVDDGIDKLGIYLEVDRQLFPLSQDTATTKNTVGATRMPPKPSDTFYLMDNQGNYLTDDSGDRLTYG